MMCASTVQVAALPGEVVSNTGKQNRKVLAAPVTGAFAFVAGATTLLRQKHGNCPPPPIFLRSIPFSFVRRSNHYALEQQPIDEDNAKALILRLASEQYAALGNEEYETNRLRRLFSAFECVAELNADLLKSTVSEVLVTRQNVKLRLKNGQVIERSDLQ